jgi:hypothetical protein
MEEIKVKVDDGAVHSYPFKGRPFKMTQLVFGGIGNGKTYGYFKGGLKSLKLYFNET